MFERLFTSFVSIETCIYSNKQRQAVCFAKMYSGKSKASKSLV